MPMIFAAADFAAAFRHTRVLSAYARFFFFFFIRFFFFFTMFCAVDYLIVMFLMLLMLSCFHC